MCLLTLIFYRMQFHASYFTFIWYQLILIIGFVPKIKYLCFDLLICIYMTLGLKFLLCEIGKFFYFKKILSGIMEFQLQKIYSTETVGKAFVL